MRSPCIKSSASSRRSLLCLLVRLNSLFCAQTKTANHRATGIGLTVLAFVNAYRALRKGDSRQANKMFRARIAAQGFTVVAMVAGSMYYSKDREKSKELRKLKDERDAEEKRQKWIRELEVRDEEDKAMRALIQKKQSGLSTGQSDSAPGGEETQGTGGVLGKMGLWSKGEKAAAEAAKAEAAAEPASEKKSRRENPKSSLGALSEIYGKKDDESKK